MIVTVISVIAVALALAAMLWAAPAPRQSLIKGGPEMPKVIIVEECRKCPYRHQDTCQLARDPHNGSARAIIMQGMPQWCPLPDKQ